MTKGRVWFEIFPCLQKIENLFVWSIYIIVLAGWGSHRKFRRKTAWRTVGGKPRLEPAGTTNPSYDLSGRRTMVPCFELVGKRVGSMLRIGRGG